MTGLVWRRSSQCEAASCVEVATTPDAVLVRDSKNPGGPVLRFTRVEWVAFTGGVRDGEFDPQA